MNFSADILVIGSGWAGFAAAMEASRQGLTVILVEKSSGATAFSSGALDVADAFSNSGNFFREEQLSLEKNLEEIIRKEASHPYTRLSSQLGLGFFQDFLYESIQQTCVSLPFQWCGDLQKNRLQVTSLGNLKSTAKVPENMADADILSMNQAKILVVGIKGLATFQSGFIKDHLLEIQSGQAVPYIQFVGNLDLEVPGVASRNSITDFEIAHALDQEKNFVPFAQSLLSYLQGKVYTHVLLPPCMGFVNVELIHRTLKKITGLQVAECLAYQMNVPGLRLKHAIKKSCESRGIQWISGEVKTILKQGDSLQAVEVESQKDIIRLHAKSFVFAGGKYLGGVIRSVQDSQEKLFSLSLTRADEKHGEEGLDLQNLWKKGVLSNESFQPYLSEDHSVLRNLYAAGSILSGYDYIQGRCGAGVAIVTGVHAAKVAAAKIKNFS